MEGKKSKQAVKPRAILVFGAPCSGKTKFAEQFSDQFKAPFFNLAELSEQSKLTRQHLLLIVEQIAKTKQTLIIEGGLDTEKDRTEVRNILRAAGYEPTLVWIQTDAGTLKQRLRQRLKSADKAKKIFDEKTQKLEAPGEAERPIVLSGKHTYATQIKHVLKQLAQ